MFPVGSIYALMCWHGQQPLNFMVKCNLAETVKHTGIKMREID